MTSYGVTATGFAQKTLTEIKAEIEQSEKDLIDPALDMTADGPLGIMNGIMAAKLAELWEVGLAVYRSFDPSSAADDALDNVSQLTGTTRLDADESTVTVQCTGTAATVLLTGQVVTTGANDRFESTADATLALATVWAITTAYVVGDIRSNDTNIYVCTTAGTSAGAGGPTGTGDAIADNTVVWNFVGDGLSYASVPFQSEETGAISIDAGAIDTEDSVGAIETPVAGWEDARNTADGVVGQAIEVDAVLRVRREDELEATGTATLESLIADTLRVDDVTQVVGFENVTDVTDGDGIPPHSFELVVLGGVDQEIADQIWESKAGGIRAHGTETESVTDSQGDTHTIKFTRPSEITIHVKATYTTDSTYPSAGDTTVKATIAAWGNALGIGGDVIISQLYEVIFEATSGVVDITEILIGLVGPAAGVVNLTITDRQIADFDVADIDLVVT